MRISESVKEPSKPQLPEAIKELRRALRLTQTSLAAQLGLTLSAVQKWEMAETRPSPQALWRLYKLSMQVDRPELHAVFVTGQPTPMKAAESSAIFDLARMCKTYLAVASKTLTQVIMDPSMDDNQRLGVVTAAIWKLTQGQQEIDVFVRQFEEAAAAGGAGKP